MKTTLLLTLIVLAKSISAQNISWVHVSSFSYSFLEVREEKLYGGNALGVYLSLDGGTTHNLIGAGQVRAMALKGDTLFVSFSHCFGDRAGIFYTLNDGISWVEVNDGYDLDNGDYEMCSNDAFLFIAGARGVYRSLNGGHQWEEVLPTSHPGGGGYSITCQGELVVVGSVNKIFISQDNGTTWTQKLTPLTQHIVWEVASYNDKIFIGTPLGIFVSNDLGNTWTHKGPFDTNISAIRFCGNIAIAGSYDSGGILYSEDIGESWVNINEGLDETNLNIGDIILYQDYFIMGSNHLHRSQGIECTSVTSSLEADSPISFEVFPNPATSDLFIQTDLMDYDLIVYDVNGKPVFFQTNINGAYTLDDETLPIAGTYFLALKTGSDVVYKSVVKF
ncbi:MAG: T9SS type A sorting domain-containing protein [Saprospiraceae bacterium]